MAVSREFSSIKSQELRCSGWVVPLGFTPLKISMAGRAGSGSLAWKGAQRELTLAWVQEPRVKVSTGSNSPNPPPLTRRTQEHFQVMRTQGQSMLNLLKLPRLPQIRIQNKTAKPLFTSGQLQYQAIILAIVLKITLQCTQIRYFTTQGLKLALRCYT